MYICLWLISRILTFLSITMKDIFLGLMDTSKIMHMDIGLQSWGMYILCLCITALWLNDDLPSSLGISMTKTLFLNPWRCKITSLPLWTIHYCHFMIVFFRSNERCHMGRDLEQVLCPKYSTLIIFLMMKYYGFPFIHFGWYILDPDIFHLHWIKATLGTNT